MQRVVIPNNTQNSISKISEHPTALKTTHLFLGNLQATSIEFIQQYKIKAILTVGLGLEVKPPQGVAHKVIHIEDHPQENIAQYFSECNEFIRTQLEKGNVLVHCLAGMSRSASVVLAYTMKTKKIKLSNAFQKVRQKRNIINPNSGFLSQLKQYQRKLAKRMQEKGQRLK